MGNLLPNNLLKEKLKINLTASKSLLNQSFVDIETIRQDFPILHQTINKKPLAYLDNAASSQKPLKVIDIEKQYYLKYNANVNRGVHYLSCQATQRYEQARLKVQQFIHAKSHQEIIFVKGTTEAINLVTQTFGRTQLSTGDEILLTQMEHHANIVPWQLLCEQTGSVLKVIPIDSQGDLDLMEFEKLLTEKTKILAVTHISNVLGTINPVQKMIELAHTYDVPVLIDGAQAVSHMTIDV